MKSKTEQKKRKIVFRFPTSRNSCLGKKNYVVFLNENSRLWSGLYLRDLQFLAWAFRAVTVWSNRKSAQKDVYVHDDFLSFLD